MTIDLMDQGVVSAPQHVMRRYGPRALFSVLAVAVMGYWLLWSLLLAMFTCGDNCHVPAEADWWGYDAQLFLAAAGCLLGVIALVLGFTSRVQLHRRLVLASLGCGLVWVLWVMGSGIF